MEIRFYKKNLRWYADLPEFIAAGGEEADCEMVDYVKLGRDSWESYSAHDVDYDKQTVVLSYSNFENGAYKNVYTEPFPFEIVPLNKKEVSYVI